MSRYQNRKVGGRALGVFLLAVPLVAACVPSGADEKGTDPVPGPIFEPLAETVSLAMPMEDVLRVRPEAVRFDTLLIGAIAMSPRMTPEKPIESAATYVERLPEHRFFDDISYGFENDRLTFVNALGPPRHSPFEERELVRALVESTIARFGTQYRTRVFEENGGVERLLQIELSWDLAGDRLLSLTVPTFETLRRTEGRRGAKLHSVRRYSFLLQSGDSYLGKSLADSHGRRELDEGETTSLEFYEDMAAMGPARAPGLW